MPLIEYADPAHHGGVTQLMSVGEALPTEAPPSKHEKLNFALGVLLAGLGWKYAQGKTRMVAVGVGALIALVNIDVIKR